MSIFALLVNPRDGTPVYAEKTGDRTVAVFLLSDLEVGEGYFNDEAKYALSEAVTGLPRVHTPIGTSRRGTGLGTALYTGLCAAAYLQSTAPFKIGVDVSGPGISSEPSTRSAAATRWWDRARTAYGLASRITGCAAEQFEDEEFSGTSTPEIEDLVRRKRRSRNVDVADYTLTVTGSDERCDVEADQYLYATAERLHLVASLAPLSGAKSWDDVDPSDDASLRRFGRLDPAAFAAINVGSLWEPTARYTDAERSNAFRSLVELARRAGCSRAVLDGMGLRFVTKSDVDLEDWSHPDYAWVADEIRQNPARKSPRDSRHERPKFARATRMPPVGAKFYGVRRNPPTLEPALAKELTGLAARRHKLGWDVFAADPDAP